LINPYINHGSAMKSFRKGMNEKEKKDR